MLSLIERLRQESYQEGPFLVFTERAHLKRGFCCGSQCRHCPYEPRASKGNTAVTSEIQALWPDLCGV